MNQDYRQQRDDRAKNNIPPLPLTAADVKQIAGLLGEGKATPPDGDENLVELLAARVPAGVDPAAKVKSAFLADIVGGRAQAPGIDRAKAIAMLGDMQGGYNLPVLIAW